MRPLLLLPIVLLACADSADSGPRGLPRTGLDRDVGAGSDAAGDGGGRLDGEVDVGQGDADGGAPALDAMAPDPDSAAGDPDGVVAPDPDVASAGDADASEADPDAAPPEPDAAPPEPDAAPEPDADLSIHCPDDIVGDDCPFAGNPCFILVPGVGNTEGITRCDSRDEPTCVPDFCR